MSNSVTPWTAACQASLSINNFWSLLKLMSIESVMPSNHLTLCRPLLFLHSFFPSIRVFSDESALRIRWPTYWSFSFSISPTDEHPGLISFRMDWLDLLAVQGLSDCQHIQIPKLDLLNFNYLCNSFPLYPGSDIISCKRLFSKYFRLSRPDVLSQLLILGGQ